MEPEFFYGLVREPNNYFNQAFEKLKSLVDYFQPVIGVNYEFLVVKKITDGTKKEALEKGMFAHMIEYDKLWSELVRIKRRGFYIESMPVIKSCRPVDELIKDLNQKLHAHILIHSNGLYSTLDEINQKLSGNDFSFSVITRGLAELIVGFEINPANAMESIDKFVTKIREGLIKDFVEINGTTTIIPMLSYCNKP